MSKKPLETTEEIEKSPISNDWIEVFTNPNETLEPIVVLDKKDLGEIEFKILPTSFKTIITDYENTPAVKALIDGQVILVPHNTTFSKMYRFARVNGYEFHKKKSSMGMILWLDKITGTNE
jgi:hypothetical protein